MIPEAYPHKRPKAILFDWDNTLVDTSHVSYNALNTTLEAMGHQAWSFADFMASPPNSLRNSFPSLFGGQWKKAETIFYDTFEKNHLETLRPFDGVKELLSLLQKEDIYTSIVSNKTGHFLRKEIQHLGWESLLTKAIGAKDTDEDKPSPLPVAMALRDSGLEMGKDVWFVGDSIVDVTCAVNAGCVPVVVGSHCPHTPVPVIRLKEISLLAKLLNRM